MGDTDAGSGRWMTYDEIAALRGIKRIGAVRLVQRYKWRRMEGNDGKARILVPAPMLEPVRRSSAGISAPTTDAGTKHPDSAGTDAGTSAINALQAAFQTALAAKDASITAKDGQIEALKGQVAAAQAEAATARKAVDQAELDVDRLEAELEAAKIGQAEAQADVAELRQHLEQARAGGRLARAWRAWRGE